MSDGLDWVRSGGGQQFIDFMDYVSEELSQHVPTSVFVDNDVRWACECGRMTPGDNDSWHEHVAEAGARAEEDWNTRMRDREDGVSEDDE